jgi:phage shock protein PspC (stress-responsive transcriptional regulator)
METTNTTHQPVRQLERRHDDRMIAGVSGALARRLDIPLGLVRALFVILVFAGGFGLAAYLTGILLIPAEHETRTPTRRWFDRAVTEQDTSRRVGWALLTVAAIVVIASTGLLSAPLIVAGALVALAVAIIDRNNTKEDA